MDDIFDTRFESKPVELDGNFVLAGDQIDLMAKEPTLKNILIGAGWDLNIFDAEALDIDVSLFLLDKNNQTRVDEDFIFYNQRQVLNGGIKHHGDSRTGAGDGDDETLTLDLYTIPFDIFRVAIVLSIYKGFENKQNFGMVRRAYMRIVNGSSQREICRFELDKVFTDNEDTALVAGYLDREGPKWFFRPVAEFNAAGLGDIARGYGIIVNQE